MIGRLAGRVDYRGTDHVMIDVGGLAPLPDDYCGLRVRLAPADDDAANLPVAAGVPNDMVGFTIYLEGTYNGGNPFAVLVLYLGEESQPLDENDVEALSSLGYMADLVGTEREA